MSAFRVFIGLLTVFLVEGSAFYTPLLNLNTFWVKELELFRWVVLGSVICGLAVTGVSKAPVEAKPGKKVLRRKDSPPEKDPGLEAMAAAFREKLESHPMKPGDGLAEVLKPVEEPVDFVELQNEINKEEEKPAVTV